jgi:hypothetical protein
MRGGAVQSRAFKIREDGLVEVFDLDFAAYCVMQRLPIADLVQEKKPRQNGSRNGFQRYVFCFLDPDARIAQLSLDWTNSECARFADSVRRLKKTVRSAPRSPPNGGG